MMLNKTWKESVVVENEDEAIEAAAFHPRSITKQIKAIRVATQRRSWDVLLKKSKTWKPLEQFEVVDIVEIMFYMQHDPTSKIKEQQEEVEEHFDFEDVEDEDEDDEDEDEVEAEAESETESTYDLDNLITNVSKYIDDSSKQPIVQQLAEKAKDFIDSYNLATRCPKKYTVGAFKDLVNSYVKCNKTEIVNMTTGGFVNDSKARRSEKVAEWLVKNVANLK